MSDTRLILSSVIKVGIVYRPATPEAIKLAKSITTWLKKKKIKVFTGPDQKNIVGTSSIKPAEFGNLSLVLAIGGDGTYLRACRLLGGRLVPILGIHLGSLGFLTPTRSDETFAMLEKTLNNQLDLVPRSMLRVCLRTNDRQKKFWLALNDMVIERGSLSQLINISLFSERKFISEIKGDGIIVSTPTGSTGYNLSAGGPIVHPDVKAFSITPISPHSLTSRSMIISDDKRLTFRLIGNQQKAHLNIDGQTVADLNSSQEITLERSQTDHLMVQSPQYNYFDLLREKLKFGDRI